MMTITPAKDYLFMNSIKGKQQNWIKSDKHIFSTFKAHSLEYFGNNCPTGNGYCRLYLALVLLVVWISKTKQCGQLFAHNKPSSLQENISLLKADWILKLIL